MKGQRVIRVLGRAIKGRLHPLASDRLRLIVFPVLREDEIVRIIRYDWMVITYGNILCSKYVPHFQHNMIRARLRLAGRLLLAVKKINQYITDFASIYNPRHYDSVVEAIKIISGFSSISYEFKSPATAAAAVTHVKQIGSYLIDVYIRKDEQEKQRLTENFLKLMQSDISISINKNVFEQQCKMRREKQEKIPSTEDIKTFATYLDRERKRYFDLLMNEISFDHWFELAKLIMASIIVFNRRRTGEVQNITLTDFQNRRSIDESTETFQSLSGIAKEIARRYERMLIRGKKTRPVPVLLKPDIVRCIQLIVKHRNAAGVADDNPYLFALPTIAENQIRVVSAVHAMKRFSEMCGANDPESLRGTTIRKHMATLCISFDLNDSGVAEVAAYLGHHDKIHREYYRKNPVQNEFVKISQLLEKAQGNDEDDEDNGEEFGVVDDVQCGAVVVLQNETPDVNDGQSCGVDILQSAAPDVDENEFFECYPEPDKCLPKASRKREHENVDCGGETSGIQKGMY